MSDHATESKVNRASSRRYAGNKESTQDAFKQSKGEKGLSAFQNRNENTSDLDAIEEMAEAAPVRKLLNMVLLLAIRDKASDIHFEPFEDEYKMRYRVDGVLYELVPPPRHLAPAISSRSKVIANLDVAERTLPQQRGSQRRRRHNTRETRSSTLPTHYGL